MRIIFMGTPHFAVASLAALLEAGHDVVAVITAPDKPAGRGRKLSASPVKEFALEKGIPVLQPTNLKKAEFVEELRAYAADLQIVVAFRMLPEVVWNMPPKGTFNLHASLLPQYRGAAPINWAIINGEAESGVTTFFIRHEIDTGSILMSEKVAIGPNDTAGDLHDKLMVVGAKLLVQTADAIKNDTYCAVPQEESNDTELKPAPKLYRETCRIDWKDTTRNIHNKIRGLSPYPGAWTVLYYSDEASVQLKVFKAGIADGKKLAPGQIDTDGKSYMHVGTADGAIQLELIQMAGKKRMAVDEMLRGFQLDTAAKLK